MKEFMSVIGAIILKCFPGFTGKIVLNIHEGRVKNLEKTEHLKF